MLNKSEKAIGRRKFLQSVTSLIALGAMPASAFAQTAPSARKIEGALSAAPQMRIPDNKRIRRKDLRRRRDIRVAAPSIDIQAINFEFGSARIPYDEHWKAREIAIAMRRILRRNPQEVFLIEGHTDAVGSRHNNQLLSEDRAASLRRLLVRRYDVDSYALETVGYGEEYLLVQTNRAEWRNRRVTLRRVTDFLVR